MAQMAGTRSAWIIDVDENDFQTKVLERSRELPVLVDFWAVWCGPCRTLGPMLEAFANQHSGKFVLAKVNVDENQSLAMTYGIQGIPTVKAFRNGKVVSEFVGAQPRPNVERFVNALLPNEAQSAAEDAQRSLEAGDYEAAEKQFSAILAREPEQPDAMLGMAAVLVRKGDLDGADNLAQQAEAAGAAEQAGKLQREIMLRRQLQGQDETSLLARLQRNPKDVEALYLLAGLRSVEGRHEDALSGYLEVVRADRHWQDDAGRLAMLNLFEQLGDDPLVREYRNKLALVLF